MSDIGGIGMLAKTCAAERSGNTGTLPQDPDDRQISSYLHDLGLEPEDRYGFGNEFVFITDVGQDGDNVLLDDGGNLRFIDPIIGLKQPLLEMFDRILAANAADAGADTVALESRIDALVYCLYSLTDEEIAIVENR